MKVTTKKSDGVVKTLVKRVSRKKTVKKEEVATPAVAPVAATPRKVVMSSALGAMNVVRKAPLTAISKPQTICGGHRMCVCKVRSHRFKLV